MATAQTNATDDWVEIRPVTPARVQVDKKFKIPLIIHQSHAFYRLPSFLAKSIQSWIDLNPEFEHRYYDDQAMADYVRRHGSPEFIRAFDFVANLRPKTNGAIKADLFRLLLISREGGVWADADRRAVRPIMTVLTPDDQFLCGIRPENNELLDSFEIMFGAPGHPFITAALDNIGAAQIHKMRLGRLGVNRRYSLSRNYTGPGPFRRAVRSLAPSPHPRVAGVHKLAERPDFTYTIILPNQLNGQLKACLFLSANMHGGHMSALEAMGMTSYWDEVLSWTWRDRALDLINRAARLIARPREIPGAALGRIKRLARKSAN